MSFPATVARKIRQLHDAIVLDTSNVPAFPSAHTAEVMKFKGDFQGALVLWIQWIVSGTFDLTTLDGKLQQSEDGSTWYDVDTTNLAFTQLAANGDELLHVPANTHFMRYLRVALTAGASGTTTNVEIRVGYHQIGAPGPLAYAGTRARRE